MVWGGTGHVLTSVQITTALKGPTEEEDDRIKEGFGRDEKFHQNHVT